MAIGSTNPSAAFRGAESVARYGRATSGRDPAAQSIASAHAVSDAPALIEGQGLSKLIASANAAAVSAATASPESAQTIRDRPSAELLTGVYFRKPVQKAQNETPVAKTDRPTADTDTAPGADRTYASEDADAPGDPVVGKRVDRRV